MLTRLSALFLALSLGSAGLVSANQFAQPPGGHVAATEPNPQPEIVAMPMIDAPTDAEIRTALRARRAKNLASFRAYAKAGVYPHNTWRVGPMNVWMDEDGHLCAAATMISKDGLADLVEKTAQKDNQIRLLNVKDGVLLDWILTSGFTIEEIDMIQAPMIYPDRDTPEERKRQDMVLKSKYDTTDKYLVKNAKADLEIAVKRLAANPFLARKLVDDQRALERQPAKLPA